MSIERIRVRNEEYSFRSFFVNANGQRIHCVEGGEGPVVLFVHGFPESWYLWRYQMVDVIKQGYRAVAISPRGFGRSSKPRDYAAYRITELAKDLAEVVKALGQEKVYLVGHDWGATTAWTAAWLYPECFHGIVGISNAFDGCNVSALPFDPENRKSASQVWEEWGNEERMYYQEYFTNVDLAESEMMSDARSWLFNAYWGWSGLPKLPAVLEGIDRLNMTDAQIRDVLRQTSIFKNRAKPNNPVVKLNVPAPEWLSEEDMDYLGDQYNASGFYGGLNYYKAMDLDWELLRYKEDVRITIPCMYIGGDRDWVVLWSRDALKKLPERCDDLRGMTILKDTGHWQEIERHDEVSAEILRFLKSFE